MSEPAAGSDLRASDVRFESDGARPPEGRLRVAGGGRPPQQGTRRKSGTRHHAARAGGILRREYNFSRSVAKGTADISIVSIITERSRCYLRRLVHMSGPEDSGIERAGAGDAVPPHRLPHQALRLYRGHAKGTLSRRAVLVLLR